MTYKFAEFLNNVILRISLICSVIGIFLFISLYILVRIRNRFLEIFNSFLNLSDKELDERKI